MNGDIENADRALVIVQQLAATAAHNAGVNAEFFMTEMNYRWLVPVMRELMSDGQCLSCGHAFLGERDIQIEHIEPPRHKQDWARLHARNLGLFCGVCTTTRRGKPFEQWLREQWLKEQESTPRVGPRVNRKPPGNRISDAR